MNCPLATSRFFMDTLHQVQRRSGRSAAEGSALEGAAGEVDIAGILSERQEACQPNARSSLGTKKFVRRPLQPKIFVV
jgi:hypothetical protein